MPNACPAAAWICCVSNVMLSATTRIVDSPGVPPDVGFEPPGFGDWPGAEETTGVPDADAPGAAEPLGAAVAAGAAGAGPLGPAEPLGPADPLAAGACVTDGSGAYVQP